MSAEEDLRLAWQADRDGKPGRRDALLTLAAAQAPAGAAWVQKCRARLIEGRPDHLFAHFASVPEALAHPKVASALEKLRALYPPGKVANLVRRDEVSRGRWLGRRPALSVILDDLFGSQRRRLGQAEPVRQAPHRPPMPATPAAEVPSRLRFTLGVLWTIAILMEVVARESGPKAGTRAA